MSEFSCEWNASKAALSHRKHGVTFDEAATVFEDAEALLLADPDHSAGEERSVLLGFSARLRLLVVVHCERREGSVIRIISARKANPMERHQYSARRA